MIGSSIGITVILFLIILAPNAAHGQFFQGKTIKFITLGLPVAGLYLAQLTGNKQGKFEW